MSEVSNNTSESDLQKYQSILAHNGIKGVISTIKILQPELKGDNFASICESVTLELEGGEVIQLFIKKLPTHDGHFQMVDGMNLFPNEAFFFNVLLLDLRKYYKEKVSGEVKELDFFPKCYYADNHMIVMENLTKRGYTLLSKLEKHDLGTAKLVLQNLAKYHGVSYGMIYEDGLETFLRKYGQGLKEPYNNPHFSEMIKNCMNQFLPSIEMLLKSSGLGGSIEALNKIQPYIQDPNRVMDKFKELCNPESGHIFPVINHGDPWNCNFLFYKDPETDQLTRQVFVDFQGSRIGSPNLDLGYFLFTSVKREVRQGQLDELLSHYFHILSDTIQSLKVPFSFTYEEFVKDFKIKSEMGFWNYMIGFMAMDAWNDVKLDDFEGDFGSHFINTLMVWLEKNPEKASETLGETIETIHEFFAYQN